MLRHYLLTRFNLALYKRNKYLSPVRGDGWLRQRFELFERYCLPSVRAQTQQGFVWFVLFDKTTPHEYVERVLRYTQELSCLRPLWIEPQHSWHYKRILCQAIAQDIQSHREAGASVERVVTTWLDNDDALSLDAMEQIARVAEGLPMPSFISFPYGLQYFTELGIATRVRYPNNHFLSLVEELSADGMVRTAFGYGSHAKLHHYQEVGIHIEESQEPTWVEVVHSGNVGNDVLMRWRMPVELRRGILRERFGVDVLLSPHARRIYYTRFMARRCREVVRLGLLGVLRRLPRWAFDNADSPAK